jgi:hypothetical protein
MILWSVSDRLAPSITTMDEALTLVRDVIKAENLNGKVSRAWGHQLTVNKDRSGRLRTKGVPW